MSDWFDKYLKVNITAKLTMIGVSGHVLEVCGVVYEFEEPITQQSAFVSVIMGVMTGVYGLYLGKEAKGKAMPGHYGKKPKNKKLAGMYGDKNKVTRGDIIMAAKESYKKGKA